MRHPARALVAIAAAALLAAGCGSDDEADIAADTTSVGSAVDDSSVVTTAPVVTDQDADGDGSFPVAIEHKYGSTTIGAEPTRVVSVGFNDQDVLLALGVIPVGIRDWYGEQPFGTWPWAIADSRSYSDSVMPE